MKKIIATVIVAIMGISVVACGNPDKYHRTPKEDDVKVNEINIVSIKEETILTEEILYENVIVEDNVTYWEDVG